LSDEWNLKISVAKLKMVVFKKEEKLSGDEKWWLCGEVIKVVKEMKYQCIVLDSGSKCEEERKQVVIWWK
jgi:hypothetical protein